MMRKEERGEGDEKRQKEKEKEQRKETGVRKGELRDRRAVYHPDPCLGDTGSFSEGSVSEKKILFTV